MDDFLKMYTFIGVNGEYIKKILSSYKERGGEKRIKE